MKETYLHCKTRCAIMLAVSQDTTTEPTTCGYHDTENPRVPETAQRAWCLGAVVDRWTPNEADDGVMPRFGAETPESES